MKKQSEGFFRVVRACESAEVNDANLVIADYRVRNGTSKPVGFAHAVLTLMNKESGLKDQHAACASLVEVSKDRDAKFAERLSATVLVYSHGERELAKHSLCLSCRSCVSCSNRCLQ